MKYQPLHRWKYRLLSDEEFQTGIRLEESIITPYIWLNREGLLCVRAGYCWDGASGPAIDTPSIMRGSLAHDAGYALLRMGILPREYKETFDRLLYYTCRQDGMLAARAQWVYQAVRFFGGGASKLRPGYDDPVVLEAP